MPLPGIYVWIIYCCIKNYPNLSISKQQTHYFFKFLRVFKCLKLVNPASVLHETANQGISSCFDHQHKVWVGLEDSLPGSQPWLLKRCFSSLPYEPVHMTVGIMYYIGVNNAKKKENGFKTEVIVSYNLSIGGAHPTFYTIIFITQCSARQCGGELHMRMNNRRQELLSSW